jgi:hypothetical protein
VRYTPTLTPTPPLPSLGAQLVACWSRLARVDIMIKIDIPLGVLMAPVMSEW